MLSLSTANVAGATKQSITSAFVFAGYNVGNIIAPYLTLASEAPIHYRRTFVAIITCMAITIVLTLILDAGTVVAEQGEEAGEGEGGEEQGGDRRNQEARHSGGLDRLAESVLRVCLLEGEKGVVQISLVQCR